jgi:hypothetical protein
MVSARHIKEALMSEGNLPDEAWVKGLRDYFRAPTPMSTIIHLTPRETAKHLRVTERTLERRRLIGDGPPYVKIGASIRYPLRELEKWLEERTQCSTSETVTPVSRRRRKAQRAPSDPPPTAADSAAVRTIPNQRQAAKPESP